MLAFLDGKVSSRKLRLFAVACCRRIEQFISDPRSRHAVAVVEQFADGLVDLSELQSAHAAGEMAWVQHDVHFGAGAAAAAEWQPERDANSGMWGIAEVTDMVQAEVEQLAFMGAWGPAWAAGPRHAKAAEGVAQAKLLRDVVGNPFRPVTIAPLWLTAPVVDLASGICERRGFEALPILADALEEAGCTARAILDHLRGPGPHVRGCWVLDLLLEKE